MGIDKFYLLPSELVVGIVKEARFDVALVAAHSTRKQSAINAVRARILSELFGDCPIDISLKLFISNRKLTELRFVKMKEGALALSEDKPNHKEIFELGPWSYRVKQGLVQLLETAYSTVKAHHEKSPVTLFEYRRSRFLCRWANHSLLCLYGIFQRTVQESTIRPFAMSAASIKLGKEIEFFFNAARTPVIGIKRYSGYCYLQLVRGRVKFPTAIYNDHFKVFTIFCDIFRLYHKNEVSVEIDDVFLRLFHKYKFVSTYDEVIFTKVIKLSIADVKEYYKEMKDIVFKVPIIETWDPEIFQFIDS